MKNGILNFKPEVGDERLIKIALQKNPVVVTDATENFKPQLKDEEVYEGIRGDLAIPVWNSESGEWQVGFSGNGYESEQDSAQHSKRRR